MVQGDVKDQAIIEVIYVVKGRTANGKWHVVLECADEQARDKAVALINAGEHPPYEKAKIKERTRIVPPARKAPKLLTGVELIARLYGREPVRYAGVSQDERSSIRGSGESPSNFTCTMWPPSQT